jgi:hypothetical protein
VFVHSLQQRFPQETGRDHLGQLGRLDCNETLSPEEAQEVTEKHSAAIFQNVITKEAAHNLRDDYAMAANHELESSFVHSPSHRYHLMPPHTEPTVQEALKQVAEHPLVRPVLDGHLGVPAPLWWAYLL